MIKKQFYWMKHQSRQENLLYVALWAVSFIAPLLSQYVHSLSDGHMVFRWYDVRFFWLHLMPFLLLFVIHDVLLAPLLIYRQKPWHYAVLTLAMLACFTFYQCSTRPPEPQFHHPERQEMPPPFAEPPQHVKRPPAIIGEHDIVAIIVLVLILGLNLGIKSYFKSREDSVRLAALEKESLEQQLEYLRYQINPHFFMNTLNNIHALVDIDPETAKSTIVELSRMMRYVLYEGNKKDVLLASEFDFLRHYVALMRLRFTDKVEVKLELPEAVNAKLPPLILITFVENAFKHGISYEHESFVHVGATVSGRRLHFRCSNSKGSGQIREKGGVGLTNVRQRLDLIYGEDYTLSIDDRTDTYNVELEIPLV